MAEPQLDELDAEVDAQLAEPRLHHYRGYADRLKARIHDPQELRQIDEAARTSTQDTRAMARDRDMHVGAFLRLRRAVRLTRLLVIFPAIFWGVWIFRPDLRASLGDMRLNALGSVVVLALPVALMWLNRARRAAVKELTEKLQDLGRQQWASAVAEALNRAINHELANTGIFAFPTSAPRLVELDDAVTTPSRTLTFIQTFVSEHETSAIGLAGPRGSGKSTILSRLTRSPELKGLKVFVSSPVRYERKEFLRHLIREVADQVAPTAYSDFFPILRLGRVTVARVVNGFVLLLAGALLFTVGSLDSWKIPPSYSVLEAGGIVTAMFGGILLMTTFVAYLVGSSRTRSASENAARKLLEHLQWEVSQGQTSKFTGKHLAGIFEFGDEATRSRKMREFSGVDLVAEFRKLLVTISTEGRYERIVIVVDELDKLNTPESLIEAINDLKDLFHIRYVHFLVSVSTEALRSFELRMLGSRDAFDSSFDTIVRVAPMSAEESVKVIQSRVPNFPASVALLCHAWAAGNARDVIRGARRCVEIQRDADDVALPGRTLARRMAGAEALQMIGVRLQATDPTSDDRPELLRVYETVDNLVTHDVTDPKSAETYQAGLKSTVGDVWALALAVETLVLLVDRDSRGRVSNSVEDEYESVALLMQSLTEDPEMRKRAARPVVARLRSLHEVLSPISPTSGMHLPTATRGPRRGGGV